MYSFFLGFSEPGAPSFSKFARSIGATLQEIQEMRKRPKFDRAWRECNEIRRDYLIDQALTKRHDASFTKFLIDLEYADSDNASKESELSFKLEVVE